MMRARSVHAKQQWIKLWLFMKPWVPSSYWRPWRDTDCSRDTAFPVNLVDRRCSCFNKLKQRRSNLPVYHEKKKSPHPLEGYVCHKTAALQPHYQAEQCKLCLMHSSCVFHLPALLGCQYTTRLSQRTAAPGWKAREAFSCVCTNQHHTWKLVTKLHFSCFLLFCFFCRFYKDSLEEWNT